MISSINSNCGPNALRVVSLVEIGDVLEVVANDCGMLKDSSKSLTSRGDGGKAHRDLFLRWSPHRPRLP